MLSSLHLEVLRLTVFCVCPHPGARFSGLGPGRDRSSSYGLAGLLGPLLCVLPQGFRLDRGFHRWSFAGPAERDVFRGKDTEPQVVRATLRL